MPFLVVLALSKTTSLFNSKETYQKIGSENGLIYNNITLKDLVNKDTDGDGIFDWEEGLWGTDPTKKETTPGIPDNIEIEKLKAAQANSVEIAKGSESNSENLTETAKFSRELFATIVAASQNGSMDQATIDTLTASLAEKMKNPVVRKIFLISDIKTIKDDTPQTFINYDKALADIYTKYPMNNNVIDILEKLIIDENTINENALLELNPIIEQINKIINALAKMSVPQSISTLHLNFMNALERIAENISDMKFFSTDTILSIGAINKYQENTDTLRSAINALNETIRRKMNN